MHRPRIAHPAYLRSLANYEVKLVSMHPLEYGECFFEDELIHINKRLPLWQQLKTLIHELIHATWPNMPESEVLRKEEDYWNRLTEDVLRELLFVLSDFTPRVSLATRQ